MGRALSDAALAIGYEVVVVSGPVEVDYPSAVQWVPVISTEEMLEACCRLFPTCSGVIGAAAPCDYRPQRIASNKMSKTGEPLELHLIETADVVATLGNSKRPDQWAVGFALETEDHRLRALAKLERKCCDLMVLNGPEAMNSLNNSIEILDPLGTIVQTASGSKGEVARVILTVIEERLGS